MDFTQVRNFRKVSETLYTAGQPTESQLESARAAGVEVVVNLALHDDPRYSLKDERGCVESLGMTYVHIPVQFAAPTEADLLAFFSAMEAHREEPILVHCGANYRVSAFLGLYNVLKLGHARDEAFALMDSVWKPDPVWTQFIQDMLSRHGGEADNRLIARRDMPSGPASTMLPNQIRFDDGAAYERFMGKWSQLAGATFLDWLAPAPGLRWLDVGCGSGAFTEMIVDRCAPSSVQGIDPSEGQLAFARTRPASRIAQFRQGDAMVQPFSDDTFDVAVMPLVIFFVPDPARGVAEMRRVVCQGGSVSAYAWDMAGGGFPYDALLAEIRALGVDVPEPPSSDASRLDAMCELWAGAGMDGIETREINVRRTFAGFDDYWTTILGASSVGPKLAAMTRENLAVLEARMRARLPADADGRITCHARANAVKGRVQ